MLKTIKNFFKEEEGMGTVEIILILVVLVSLALIFRNTIIGTTRTTLENTETKMKGGMRIDPNL